KLSGTATDGGRRSLAPLAETFIVMHSATIEPSTPTISAFQCISWRSVFRLSTGMTRRLLIYRRVPHRTHASICVAVSLAQFRDGAKRPDKILVELRAHPGQSVVGGLARERRLVGTPFDQRSENVGDRDDANEIGYFVRRQSMRISGAVEILMVVNHHVEHFRRQSRYGSEGVETVLRMLAHHGQLTLVERARLFQNGERNTRLADVVQHSRERQPLAI